MANLVVTTAGNAIRVDFNDYSAALGGKISASYDKNDLKIIAEYSDHIALVMSDGAYSERWALTCNASYSGDQFFIVDTVNTVAPTSETDLRKKLDALMA